MFSIFFMTSSKMIRGWFSSMGAYLSWRNNNRLLTQMYWCSSTEAMKPLALSSWRRWRPVGFLLLSIGSIGTLGRAVVRLALVTVA